MKIKTLFASLAAVALMTASASAGDVSFGAFAGFAGFDGSGTFTATFAQGEQSLGGQSFGKTEAFANATSDFAVGTQHGIKFNAAGNSGSGSTSGSLVNGTGAAWNQTGGIAFSGAGVGGVAGAGASW